MINRLS